jgi:hypothetical protein
MPGREQRRRPRNRAAMRGCSTRCKRPRARSGAAPDGVGYIGTYRLAFVRGDEKILVEVTIRPQ